MFACPEDPKLLGAESKSPGQPPSGPTVIDPRTVSQEPVVKPKGMTPLNSDKPVDFPIKASGGIKLGSVRYVLGISVALATVAGIVLWNVYATH